MKTYLTAETLVAMLTDILESDKEAYAETQFGIERVPVVPIDALVRRLQRLISDRRGTELSP